MTTKLDNINRWFTLLANLGVVVGLIALAAELDQSNRIASREAREANADTMFEVARMAISSPELTNLFVKMRDPQASLNDIEAEQARHIAAIYISSWGRLLVQYSTGLLPESSLEFGLSGMRHVIAEYPQLHPFIRERLISRGISETSTSFVWGEVFKAMATPSPKRD